MMETNEVTSGSFSAVSSLLWREREALQLLLFKLVEQQLILQSGLMGLLLNANDEIERAVDQVRCAEVLRAAEMNVIPQGSDTSLAELAASTTEPWATVFTEHRRSLRQLVVEVDTVTDANRALIVAGASSLGETLASLAQETRLYDAHGTPADAGWAPLSLDKQA